ncbi:MAG: hypothetical protein M3462_09045, partial [Chloroflexota bacterium]|nr:hypothetical protein [Chloroflexota bacterium]
RAGHHAESRQKFAMSHQRLRDAEADASTRNYVGVSMELRVELREESARSLDLASAPASPLEERIHKERAARHAWSSRGNREPSH